MKRIVVFTGAGVSADSGLATFRDSDGLWADYRIEDVCTPEALAHNRATVIEFYNKRRREMLAAEPNAGHRAIAELERDFEVEVLTQNVDNLHERAGSSRVTHLHGELIRLRSSRDSGLIVPIEGWEQRLDATAPDGSLLRPHIVFFGDRADGGYHGRRGHFAGGLSCGVAGALRAARHSDLRRRSRQSRYGGHPQSADPDPQTRRRGHARTGRPATGALCRIDRVLLRKRVSAAVQTPSFLFVFFPEVSAIRSSRGVRRPEDYFRSLK